MRKWQTGQNTDAFKILGVDDEEALLKGLQVHMNEARAFFYICY